MRKFKKIFITGITGSGGSYLAEHINKIDKNIKIYGSYRSTGYKKLLEGKIKNIKLFKLDLRNFEKTKKIINSIKPDALFHLASNADVRASFDEPIEFAENNNTITLTILESIRKLNLKTLIMICSTSEVYGAVTKKDIPISEKQNLNPINPYAATKLFQDIISQIYLKSFKMNPKVLVLDEATNSLDSLTEKLVMSSINNISKDITTIIVAHRLNTVRNCNTIFKLEKGRLVSKGSYQDLIEIDLRSLQQ